MDDHILRNVHFNNDCYFSRDGGMEETRHVFLAGNGLPGRILERAAGPRAGNSFVTVELGFGTGLNLATLLDSISTACEGTVHLADSGPETAGRSGPQPCLEFWTVEKFPLAPSRAMSALASQTGDIVLLKFMAELYQDLHAKLVPGWNTRQVRYGHGLPGSDTGGAVISLDLRLWYGDVLDFLDSLQQDHPGLIVDAWFLDGHDPASNPEMWNPRVFQGLAAKSREGQTTFATYTAAGLVKSGLRAAGFHVVRKPGFGQKRHMIQGHYAPKAPSRPVGA